MVASSSMLRKLRRKNAKLGGDYEGSDAYKQLSDRLLGNSQQIRDTYNTAADQTIGAAGERASQAGSNFIAQGGGRLGAGGALFSGAIANKSMLPALAEGANLRARGAEGAASNDLSVGSMLAQFLSNEREMEFRRREADAARKAERYNLLLPRLLEAFPAQAPTQDHNAYQGSRRDYIFKLLNGGGRL